MEGVPFAYIESVNNQFSVSFDQIKALSKLSTFWGAVSDQRLAKPKINFFLVVDKDYGAFYECGGFDLATFDTRLYEIDQITIEESKSWKQREWIPMDEAVAKRIAAIFRFHSSRLNWIKVLDFDIWNERFPQITNILSAIQGCRILEIEDDFPDLPIVQKTNTLWCPKQVPLVLKKTVVNLITSGNPTGICCHVDTRSTDFAYQLIQAMNAQEGNEQCQLSLDGDRPLLNIYHDWDNGYIRDFGKGHFTFQKDLTVRPL